MKNLKAILLILLIKTIFIACEPVNTFVSPALLEEGNFVDKNRQWLIDNSPFYMKNDKGENYSFSVTFLDNEELLLKECRDGVLYEESSTWTMRFSDRTRIDDLIQIFEEVEKLTFTGFCSPILHLNPNSELQIIQNTFKEKRDLEKNADFYRMKAIDLDAHLNPGLFESKVPEDNIKLEGFKYGGEDDTIELFPLFGYVLRNPETGEVGLYNTPIFNLENSNFNEISYSFINDADKWLANSYKFSYLDEWGYINLCVKYDLNASPWYGIQFISAKNPQFNQLPEATRQKFTICSGTTDPCEDLACVNGTATTGIEGNCFCDCEPGWTGPNCDQPITALPVNMQLLAGDGTQGNADGTFGQLNYPQSMVTSADGTVVYIADSGSKSIRTVNPINNAVTTLLGGNAEGYQDGDYASARFSSFGDIALDDAGNIYVSDSGNHVIRKISGGQVTTYAGTGIGGLTNGLASAAQFKYPIGLLIRNNTMYVADNENGCIRAIAMNDNPNLRTVTTYAGNGMLGHVDGANASASFAGPRDITYDAFNDRFLVTEFDVFGGSEANVRAVTATQTTTLFLDLPGSGNQILINPAGIAADIDGSFYLTDRQTDVLYHFTDLGGGFYAASMETAGLYQTPGNLGGIPRDSRLNFPNLLYIGTSLNSSSQLETRLYIANVLGQSVWYIPLR